VFLYFIPGERNRVTIERLAELGLSYAFDAADDFIQRETAAGPSRTLNTSGGPGVIVGRKQLGKEKLGHFAERQRWVPAEDFGGGDWWVGCDRENPPKPDDVVRAQDVLGGRWLQLPDGNKWLCPTAREFVEQPEPHFECALPKRLKWSTATERYEPVGVDRKYEALWLLASSYNEAIAEALRNANEFDTTLRVEFEQADMLAVMALQANYRVWLPELDLLDIMGEHTRARILDVLLDNETWQSFIKKKGESKPAADVG